jgi:GNAT superfamily N-acetyltransferase
LSASDRVARPERHPAGAAATAGSRDPTIAIRLGVPADLPRISEIRLGVSENRLADPTSITPAMCLEFMEHHGDFWVHDMAGVITGFSAADRRWGSIWALFVAAEFTGLGIGRALLDRACLTLRQAGHADATLTTTAATYAEGFYRSQGWRETARTPGGEIVFRKRL